MNQFVEHWWNEVCKKLKKSAVFIDDASAECLHWCGGLERLLQGGVVSVKEFSSFVKGAEDQKKAVFILNGPVVNLKANILEEILKNSSFEYCQVITNASPAVHKQAKYPGREIEESKLFVELEETILEWMGNFNFTCEIFYIPIHSIGIEQNIFLMPSFQNLFPLMQIDVDKALELYHNRNKGNNAINLPPDYDGILFQTLPYEMELSTNHFVSSLHSIFQLLNIKEDIFTIGRFARLIGEQLDSLPSARNRRKSATNKISLILIDRTLDLASPTKSEFGSVLDEIRANLPPFPGHSVEVQVNMASLFGVKAEATDNDLFPAGCLVNTGMSESSKALSVADLIFCDRTEIQKRFLEEISKVKQSEANPEAFLKSCQDNPEMIRENIELISKLQAVSNSRKSDKVKPFKKINENGEKFIKLLSKVKNARNFLSQITKMVRSRVERGLKLEDLLLLLTHVYALMPQGEKFFPEDEDRLQSALSEAIVKDKEDLGDILSSMAEDSEVDDVLAYQMVKKIFQKLHSLQQTRTHLYSYGNLTSSGKFNGFLPQLFQDIFADDRRDVPDLVHRSGGLGGLIKSGIGLFGVNVTKMHPRENPSIWVFIIGGITASEIKVIKDIVTSKSKCDLMIGSTCMSSPQNTMKSLFVKDPLFSCIDS